MWSAGVQTHVGSDQDLKIGNDCTFVKHIEFSNENPSKEILQLLPSVMTWIKIIQEGTAKVKISCTLPSTGAVPGRKVTLHLDERGPRWPSGLSKVCA